MSASYIKKITISKQMHLNTFLNHKIENPGSLAWIGDLGLTHFVIYLMEKLFALNLLIINT